MTYRVKDTAPQAVKDLEAEPETIEVVLRNGLHIAVAHWREHSFEEQLPRGVETWTPEEAKAVMNNVARRLKVKIGKAKWAAMAELADAVCETGHPEDLDERDHARIARAQAKRSMRAAKQARR